MPIWVQNNSVSAEKLGYEREWSDWLRSENVEGLRQAIEEGQKVDEIMSDKRSACSICGQYGLTRVYEFLKDQGSNLMKPDGFGRTLFMHAAENGHLKIVQKMLNQYEPETLFAQADEKGLTAAHLAASKGHSEVMEAMLAKKLDLGAVDELGRGILHSAMLGGSPKLIRILLGAGADAQAEDKEGRTPAKIRGALPACKQALEDGAGSSMGMMGLPPGFMMGGGSKPGP